MSTYFIDVLETAVPMSLLIGFLLLISPFTKRTLVAKWRYYMWLFAAVRLVIPFHIPVLKNPVVMQIPRQISGMPVMTGAAAAPPEGISLQTVIMIIWLLGAVLFALYQLLTYITFRKSVKRWSKPVTDEDMQKKFREVKENLNERRPLDFRICRIVSTPMVFGCIKPKLLLPDCRYTERELDVILRHEMVHFKRNDIWYKLILLLANAVNWFNPLVYVMVNAANKDIELACDAEVVKEHDMEYRRSYCEAILTVVHNKKPASAPLSTCFIISRKVIQERFRNILNLKKKRKGILLFVIVALSIAASSGAVTFATEKTADILEKELNIVERPVPKPQEAEAAAIPASPAPAPEETDAPRTYEKNTSAPEAPEAPAEEYAPESVYYEEAGEADYAAEESQPEETPQPDSTPAARYNVSEVREDSLFDISNGSVSFAAEFTEKGQSAQSSHVFTADKDTTMAVYSSSGTVSVVDADTNEVVYDGTGSDGQTARVPVKEGQRCAVIITSTEDGENLVRAYAYGYNDEADSENSDE